MKKVREFHEKMELAIDQPYSKELMDFRLKLIFEEIQELAEVALELETNLDLEERHVMMQDLLKEMCDVVYVIKGMAVSFGMDFDKAFELVHKSNMSKLPLIKDASGKVQKGLNYEPPILEGLIN
tara:strand:- start:138 stop:512 length:375 start_codon:yes stop_codon:yes gene_type:complete